MRFPTSGLSDPDSIFPRRMISAVRTLKDSANVVVDHEKVTATLPEGRGLIEAIAIYEVQGGKIAKAWLIYGPRVLDPKP